MNYSYSDQPTDLEYDLLVESTYRPHRRNCNCPKCRGSMESEEDYFLSDWRLYPWSWRIDSVKAIAANQRYARRLGWGGKRAAIAKLINIDDYQNEKLFAAAVARWQKKNGLTADGILGPRTYRSMKSALSGTVTSSPAGSGASGGKRSCPPSGDATSAHPHPIGGKYAQDNCKNKRKHFCRPLPNLLCMRGVNGIPFEYPKSLKKGKRTITRGIIHDRSLRLDKVNRVLPFRAQKFIPETREALIKFTQNMKRFGMPIQIIYTWGSNYCRCLKSGHRLSNHSFGEAIDLVGVKWLNGASLPSRIDHTILTPRNMKDPEQRRLLMRISACLRLSFHMVIDYNYNKVHTNHFHCDMNNIRDGGGFSLRGKPTIGFVQECLERILGRKLRKTKTLKERDQQTLRALSEYSKIDVQTLNEDNSKLHKALQTLFRQVAKGEF